MTDLSSADAPVLFLSNYFPPEVNALANRTWEHAREWADRGGTVEVLAGVPHFPEGRVYEGYRNRLTFEEREGVRVLRVPMYVHPNEGFVRRTLSYLSYMLSAVRHCGRTRADPGVVVASIPQFFAGLAGLLVSRRLRRPFVLEVRDLWPESIVDVGALRDGPAVRLLECLETLLYRAADHIVIVSPGFSSHIESRGIDPDRITVLPNGVDPDAFAEPPAAVLALRRDLGLEGKFVASYIGTVGMAHGLSVVAEAAERSDDPDVVFLIVGAGAEWETLRHRAEALDNLLVLPKQPRDAVASYLQLSDVSLVHLRNVPAFRKVIPSKMFESMAAGVPIILGVAGQAAEILEDSGAGITIPPEDPRALLAALGRFRGSVDLASDCAQRGRAYVREHFDRREIARRYWTLLQTVAAGVPIASSL